MDSFSRKKLNLLVTLIKEAQLYDNFLEMLQSAYDNRLDNVKRLLSWVPVDSQDVRGILQNKNFL